MMQVQICSMVYLQLLQEEGAEGLVHLLHRWSRDNGDTIFMMLIVYLAVVEEGEEEEEEEEEHQDQGCQLVVEEGVLQEQLLLKR